MADVKFTGLPAGVGIPNNGSLVAISAFDGAATYVSSKYTMTQLKDIVYVMEAEDKITFPSSGTNKIALEDEVGNNRLEYQGSQVIVLSNDGVGTTSDYSKAWLYMDTTINELGFNGTAFGVTDAQINGYINNNTQFVIKDNSAGSSTTTNVDKFVGIYNSRNATANTGVTNAVALGGVGVNADKDDYAFAQNLEVQGGTFAHTSAAGTFGVFGATPVAQPTGVAVSAAGIHAALVSLGLITA